ncbi:MAG: DUF6456 domain-containing protein [Pseudomonadota bacterium]
MTAKEKTRARHKRNLLRLLRFLEISNDHASCEPVGGGKVTVRNTNKSITLGLEVVEFAASDGLLSIDANSLKLTPEGRARLRRELYPDMAHIAQHGEIRIQETNDKQVLKNEGESPLRRLYLRKDRKGNTWIDDDQYSAGERLRRDFEIAQLQPSITANWSDLGTSAARSGSGKQAELSDFALDSRKRVEAAIAVLEGELAGLALDICCFLKGFEQVERERRWPPRSAKLMLRTALSCLVVHYGLGPRSGKQNNQVLHWGDGTHIPTI